MFKFQNAKRVPPYEAGTFNHRLEAFYRATLEFPDNDMVKACLGKGLVRVKFMSLASVSVRAEFM